MNLEELRNSLASEATEKSKEQEAEIKRLKKELRKNDDRLQEQKEMLRHMFNRCATLTQGAMCIFCGYRAVCDETRSIYNKPPKGDE